MSNQASNQTTNIIKQYNELYIDIPFTGADMNMTSIWGAGKNGFSGVWPIIWTHQVQAASAQEFVTRFRKRWDKTPENQAVNDYLAIKILAEAMAKNKSTEVDNVIARSE